MLYGIYRIKQIINCSCLDFRKRLFVTRENLIKHEVIDEILDDYIDMFNRLGDIQEIIDKLVQEEDENKNIDKLRQEGEENNEL